MLTEWRGSIKVGVSPNTEMCHRGSLPLEFTTTYQQAPNAIKANCLPVALLEKVVFAVYMDHAVLEDSLPLVFDPLYLMISHAFIDDDKYRRLLTLSYTQNT